MLKPLTPTRMTAAEAREGATFPQKLEFNAPAHGVWNIVHVGMLVPEAHQIYICAINCMRGVVLTAAEMNASDRFSCVVLKEEDLVEGTVEAVTLQGTMDVLRKLPKLPPCVLIFPVCTHHFLGADMNYIYRELERAFPTVRFVRCFMDPIMQKHGLPPDHRLRKTMYDPLPPCDPDPDSVTILGCDFPLEPDADIRRLLAAHDMVLREIQRCGNYSQYLELSKGRLILSVFPGGKYGGAQTARRLDRPFLYLPMSFDYGEIQKSLEALADALGVPAPSPEGEIAACEEALAHLKDTLSGAPVVIDATFHPRPLGLAKLLLEHGIRVDAVYLDSISGEETDAEAWLGEHAPALPLISTILPEMRTAERGHREKTLALGQKAAWFLDTPYFVNLVEGGGLWGFAGIRTLVSMMEQAWREEKDVRDLIPRKGLGCESCI